MGLRRFEELLRCIRFSDQPEEDERPPGMSLQVYRWRLVDDFVESFNAHRQETFRPSDLICVDESMSRWYGQGGEWINIGLPTYVAIDRKPENGCEIQNSACGRSGVMLRLKLVKSIEAETNAQHAHENNLESLHGTNVLMDLTRPWHFSGRVACGDSYFASVAAANALLLVGMRFSGVVKTASRKYPKAYLSGLDLLGGRGDRRAVVARDANGNPNLLAFVWVDREWRYFIASASSMSPGTPYVRRRWRQLEEDAYTLPENVELIVPQPQAAEVYYSCCAKIDQHNRHRQDTLGLEKVWKTKKWDLRVNMTILGMILVGSWKVYSLMTKGNETQKQFYSHLATELIDNNFDTVAPAARHQGSLSPESPAATVIRNRRSGVSTHLTPTKRKRKRLDGAVTNAAYQGKCVICRKKTKFMCSECVDDSPSDSGVYLSHTDRERDCFSQHMANVHTNVAYAV
jgi:Transposase IS4